MNRAILFRNSASAGFAFVTVLALPAVAGEWQIKPRIQVREGFTDNVLLTGQNRKSDFVTTVSPGLDISGQGGRIKFDLDLQANYDAYLHTTSLNGFRPSSAGFGTVTLLENSVFIDLFGSASETPIFGNGQVSAVDRRTGDNQTGGQSNLYSFGFSPYWRSGLGSWATSEVRYRFGQIYTNNDNNTQTTLTNAAAAGIAPLTNTTTNQFSGFLQSGESFSRFRWRSSANATKSESASGANSTAPNTYNQWSVDFQPSYVVDRWLTLLATIGSESIDSGSYLQDGLYWNVGFRLTPSERTSFQLTYGDRYSGRNWGSSFSTTLDAGTTVTFSYDETVQTQALQALNNFGFLQRDAITGQLVDRRTGLPFNDRDPNFNQSNQAFLSKNFVLSVSLPRERNTYLLSASYSIQDSEFTSTTSGTGQVSKSAGLIALWTHQLTPTISSTATGSYFNTTTDSSGGTIDTGKNATLRAEISLRYEMNSSLNATAGYAYVNRDVSGQQFVANQIQGAYSENVVFLTLRKTF